MQQAHSTSNAAPDVAINDLGPLAWVLEELRKSLEASSKALRRFVRDAEIARGSDLAALDSSHLRIARQQVHQAVGALEMVGFEAPAMVLRAMESAIQKFIQKPEHCSDDAASKVERAGFALTGYLEGVLAGRGVSAVSLFPQYQDVQVLAGAVRIHPADLWSHSWRLRDVTLPNAPEIELTQDARSKFDQGVLKIVRSFDPIAAAQLRDLSVGLSFGKLERSTAIFWKVAAGYFDAIAHNLLPADMHTKRAASRVLVQFSAQASADPSISERLTQDLVFFCAQAVPASNTAEMLIAVRSAYGLNQMGAVDYSKSIFGHFDPSLLAQARKRLNVAKETWSLVTAGDAGKFKALVDQFSLVNDSLTKLLPSGTVLAAALSRCAEASAKSGQGPQPALAMEVATALLYVEAVFEDLDPNDPELARRCVHLAERVESVRTGGDSQPLESWMEELYRKVSDKQTMGSVVGELKHNLAELEKSMDQFFRDPKDKVCLRDVPSQLAQMRGVLSVLGIDQASLAVMRMRDSVEQILITEIDEERARAAGTFDKLGNSLGALGFLIDMLSYQPVLAKKLFIFDEQLGELRPLMGRTVEERGVHLDSRPLDTAATLVPISRSSISSEQTLAFEVESPSIQTIPPAVIHPAVEMPYVNPSSPEQDEQDDAELLDIFLEEAREVTENGLAAVQELAQDTGSINALTTLRRAFHTLKGSSRMVGLNEFGEAGWAMEQLLNTWLADQKPANDSLLTTTSQAMGNFSVWIEAIAANDGDKFNAKPFKRSADALRLEGRFESMAIEPTANTITVTEPFEHGVESANSNTVEIGEADIQIDFSSLEALAVDFVQVLPEEQIVLTDAPAAQFVEPVDFVDFAEFSSPSAEPMPLMPISDVVETAEIADDFGVEFDTPSEKNGTSDPFSPVVEVDAPVAIFTPPQLRLVGTDTVIELPALTESISSTEEQFKAIGPLRIGIALYNVYLNEADEWSRRLLTELTEWSMETQRALPVSTVSLAHSLAGSSATVGFQGLSSLARSLESRLQASEAYSAPLAAHRHAAIFVKVAEEIRRLLHQFAAGFLKDASPEITLLLQETEHTEIADTGGIPLSETMDEDTPDFVHTIEPDVVIDSGYAALDAINFDFTPTEVPSLALVDAPSIEAMPEVYVPEADDSEIARLEALLAEHAETIELETEFEIEPVVAKATPESVVGVSIAGLGGLSVAAFTTDVIQSAQPEERVQANFTPHSIQADVADDIDALDALDPDLFPIFDEEATELMPLLGAALRQWSSRPDNQNARSEVLRVLHTLKGSARLAGAMRLGEMSHRMESDIESLGSQNATTANIEPLMGSFDTMGNVLDVLRLTPLTDVFNTSVDTPAVAITPAQNASVHTAATVSGTGTNLLALVPRGLAIATVAAVSNQSVRVKSQLLDRLVNQAGEVMITRARLEAEMNQLRGSLSDLTANLDKLRVQLRDIEVQAESQMQSRMAQAKESSAGFDPLEFDRFTRVQELTRMMAESVNDVATVQRNLQRTVEATEDDLVAQARQTRELQRDLLRTRMVEFEGISERLYRVVRQASKDAGKSVKLDITGGSIEMDRGVLDRMTPAFEHLLRNCVAHGIEEASVRSAQGKDTSGQITISLHQEGNDVSVEFRDDGAGLNISRIREKAMAQGLLTADQNLSDSDAANLIFMPGFSTASQVTELSGRGIGMDVVRSEVNALGGRIETSTSSGQGTNFKLVLPLTTAVTQVVMLRMGALSIGVPANLVEIVRRTPSKELEQAYNAGTIVHAGQEVAFYWSGALLQASQSSNALAGKTSPIVVFRSAAQRVAMHVDEVLGNQEVVVKNLGPQLSRLPGLAGMSVLASGAVVLIYNPVALATVYGEQARNLSADKAEPHVLEISPTMDPLHPDALKQNLGHSVPVLPAAVQPGRIPVVLVVDDSITVRRVTQRLLVREGYKVTLAADGLQALEKLVQEVPTLVVSDIEMPRMDGFDLVRNIRADQRLAHLPVVMITSRMGEKHRDHAMALGANHYLGKPYSEEELLSLVRRYAEAETLQSSVQ